MSASLLLALRSQIRSLRLLMRLSDSRTQVGTVEADPQQIVVNDRSTLTLLAPKALLKPPATVLQI